MIAESFGSSSTAMPTDSRNRMNQWLAKYGSVSTAS